MGNMGNMKKNGFMEKRAKCDQCHKNGFYGESIKYHVTHVTHVTSYIYNI